MRPWLVSGLGLAFALAAASAVAGDSHRGRRWWSGSCHDQLLGGPCEVKLESKPGEYKREVKCKDGVGAFWERGEWKDEYEDGRCKVKVEAKRDELKEQIVCK
jgi:hypothetical protein